jgi:hypothetical protein
MSLHFLYFVKMNSTCVYMVFDTFQRDRCEEWSDNEGSGRGGAGWTAFCG